MRVGEKPAAMPSGAGAAIVAAKNGERFTVDADVRVTPTQGVHIHWEQKLMSQAAQQQEKRGSRTCFPYPSRWKLNGLIFHQEVRIDEWG